MSGNCWCRYGHLTWEWAAGLRSYAHPLLFATLYSLLKALCAAITDVYVARLAILELGRGVGWYGDAACLVATLLR